MPAAPRSRSNDAAGVEDTDAAKLSDVVYAKIVAGIAGSDYEVGGKLPTENQLAETFSVSRPIVRQALARLRDDGMVVSRRGSGTYVRRAPLAEDRGVGPLASISDMRRCLEFRISFEGECAWHAAKAARDISSDALDRAIARLDAGIGELELPVEDDFAFHLAIAEATGNRFFAEVLRGMASSVTTGMSITRNFALLGARESLHALHDEHVAIHAAIRAGDPERAREAMRRHLSNAMKRAFEGTL